MVSLPAYSRTVAEIIMAGVDRRATCYRPLAPDEDWLGMEGVASLPQLPEAGRDHSGEQVERDFRAELYQAFEPDAKDEFLKVFNEYMRYRFVIGKERDRVLQHEKEIIDQYIGKKLKRDAEKKNLPLTYYFLVNTSKEDKQRETQLLTIKRLKDKYPFVVFLELSNDASYLLAEEETYLPLPDFIS